MERERKRDREERKRGREGEKQLLNINFPVKTLANNQTKPILFSWAQESLRMVIAAMKLRLLFLGRKAMTNLGSMLQSRDITLPTNVHLIKAMVFPVVMYGCESWTVKKAEHQRINVFELWC